MFLEKKIKLNLIIISIIITILTVLLINKANSFHIKEGQVIDGQIDLRHVQFNQEDIVKLHGKWYFYWNELIEPEQLYNTENYYNVPKVWNNNDKINSNLKINQIGSATYRLRILLPRLDKIYALHISNIRMASKIFINGEYAGGSGNPSKVKADYKIKNAPYTVYFTAKEGYADIVIWSSNLNNYNGGISTAPRLGSVQAIEKYSKKITNRDEFVIIVILILGIYNIVFYIITKSEKGHLFIGLMFVCISTAIASTGQKVLILTFPFIPGELVYRIQTLVANLILVFIILFIDYTFNGVIHPKYKKIIIGIQLAFTVFFALIPYELVMKIAKELQSFTFFLYVIILFNLLSTYRYRVKRHVSSPELGLFILAYLAFLVGYINNSLKIFGWISENNVSLWVTLVFALCVALIMAVNYSKIIKNNEESVRRAMKNEMRFLQSQIKPHFLYNALSTIMSFCYTDAKKAGELIAYLSEYLEKSFNLDKTEDYVKIEREIELTNAYLQIEKARFGGRLQVYWEIEEETVKESMPPLTLQPLVENAIRHGIMCRNEGGWVRIAIKKINEEVHILVEDNGVGINEDTKVRNISTKERQGVGLVNIKQRLLHYCNSQLNIESEVGIGTKVSFVVKGK